MSALSTDDLAVDRELADLAGGFRFLLDLTPVDLPGARASFEATGRVPRFRYRDLEDDPALAAKRLAAVPVDQVTDPILASLLLAKHRELRLQLEMLECRGSKGFLALSIELYGAVGAELLAEAEDILEQVPEPGPEEGPWLDAAAVAKAAQAELDRYRAFAPNLESHVEVREGSTGVMVSNGDVLVAPTCRVPVGRLEAVLHHEVGTHVVTHVNGAAQPLHVLASGLAGHDETQEGLAVLAEHLVDGLTARRLRQLAGRVVAVHSMVEQVPFEEVHATLVARGIGDHQAFSTTVRVFRSGGLTKDAVYLRGLRELVDHLSRGADLEVLWLGKMPLSAAPLVADLHARGELRDPLLQPRYLEDPGAQDRLAAMHQVASLAQLAGAAA
ncbi:MAG TPA: tyrosine/phenylalanine carboxypeptidase domain-containing protein [Acidimicrobiales bacterium]|nr:tyrosine/phenylalanine carboxypeptidase domain-containing protein [Acidimicrobiales bacterium]